MRIIGGSAKRKILADFSGDRIRPTSDRVREALFSILVSQIGSFEGKTVLDLFAGTGALGLEALSRGAKSAFLVDQEAQAARLIATNIQTCAFQEKAHFLRGDVLKKLPELTERGPFDLIFLDPPYGQDLVKTTLDAIVDLELLAENGIACTEASSLDVLPDRTGNLDCILNRRYGTTLIALYSPSDKKAGPL
jgi:16S rRNA (guanine(966)-N(2))-methyltransferase RsmD